nr:uncharacterized protein CI109_000727 [Kwoniella shandongensis]KAA5531155.1 hypothetical protein CI109_000727 [Kwoniella shandongensis]
MSVRVFSTPVQFLIAHPSQSLPHPGQKERTKRSSALDLLRPKSSLGTARLRASSPQPDDVKSPITSPELLFGLPSASAAPERYNKRPSLGASLRHWTSPVSRDGKGKKKLGRWYQGRIEFVVAGAGGSLAGTLRVYDHSNRPVLQQSLDPIQPNWTVEAIQYVHYTACNRPHTLSLLLPFNGTVDENASQSSVQMSSSGSHGVHPSMSPLKVLSRGRGSTLSYATAGASSSLHPVSNKFLTPRPTEESLNSDITAAIERKQEQQDTLLFLSFNSTKIRNEWFILFRSYAIRDENHIHRRLQLRVLDLHEMVVSEGQHLATDSSSSKLKSTSVEGSSVRSSNLTGSSWKHVKHGWTSKDDLCVELVVARTTWAKAEDVSAVPFWGEVFTFEGIPEPSSCASIGPTVSTIVQDDIAVDKDNPGSMLKIVEACWKNMYVAKGSVLRLVFADLFQTVRETRARQKLHYKAISSFLFLRLIGPAIMRPHLFQLAKGLPRPAVQQTLKLLAKILHAMAFFTNHDTRTDPDLESYSGFIRDNDEMMIDYLASFATPAVDDQHTPPTAIEKFVRERIAILPAQQSSAVPAFTEGGPVDYAADAAILLETYYQRRKDDHSVPSDPEVAARLERFDAFLVRTHQRAFQETSEEK